jgi:outer membrane protease
VRNITVFACLVIIFSGTQAITAQERSDNPYAISLGYQFGFLYGQAEEIVYPSDTVAPLLSQLLWDIKPVFYNGLQLDFSRINPLLKWGFFGSLALKYGIPGKSGVLEDRDWLSIENDALTNFSSHDNITNEVFMVDASAGIALPLWSRFLLKAYANYSYMRFRFSGMDGYGIYARGKTYKPGTYPPVPITFFPIDEDPILADYSGRKVINYTQEWMTLALGFSFHCYFNKYFSAGLSFQISPLIFSNNMDEHLPYTQYNDRLWGRLLLEPGAVLSLSPTPWLTIALDCSWRRISGTRGASYVRAYGARIYTQQGEAGAGLSILNTGLRLKVRL